MAVSAQIAVYPLRQERLTPAVTAVQQVLDDHGLQAEPGPMSTYVVGDDAAIFAALRDALARASSMGHVVMTVTISNACPSPIDSSVSNTVKSPPPSGQFGPDVYASWRRSSLGEITETLERHLILNMTGRLDGPSVLDVGCGDGTLALAISQYGPRRVAGCDPDARMVARAHAQAVREGHHIDLAVARSQSLPYADETFDVVTCVTVLTFIADPEAALREMAGVLRPGGRLVIGDLGKWSYWAARRRVRGWFGATLWRAARFRSANELAATIRSVGLTIHAIRGAIFFPPWAPLARLIAPFDLALGRVTTFGAAFVAIQATRP